jgi:hypothetical protein
MTTGRINQVTILSRSAEARRQLPKGSELYKVGSRRNDPNQHPKSTCSAKRVVDYSIAPTDAFQEVVYNGDARLFSRSKFAAYTSTEEKIYTATRAFARKPSKTIP